MVFYYTIRGGQCRGPSSGLTLRSQDICCYVGRDKHENEHLIKYGWPGDVWFHVDSLSSAHVYFRLRYEVAAEYHRNKDTGAAAIPLDGKIPMDDLPEESVYDMLQICKHNSIQGSKLASCRMVWSPHSNLKKQWDMDTGSVSFHDPKLCRYGRCSKDRPRIKELEKTKTRDLDIDYFAEHQANERSLIVRRKQHHSGKNGNTNSDMDALYDPVLADLQSAKDKGVRQGDSESGIDAGLAALGEMTFSPKTTTQSSSHRDPNQLSSSMNNADDESSRLPVWKQEENWRDENCGSDELLIFLMERGYPKETIEKLLLSRKKTTLDNSKEAVLTLLWKSINNDGGVDDDSGQPEEGSDEEIQQALQEEREVLDAIFGEDVDWANDNSDGTAGSSIAGSFPVVGYEAPDRFYSGSLPPPELRMEVHLPSGCKYPFNGDSLVWSIVGGGIPQEYLYKVTQQLHREATAKAKEEPGDAQIFALLTWAAEAVIEVLEQEATETRIKEDARRKAKLAASRAAASEDGELATDETSSKQRFTSEQQRREYAKTIISKAASGLPSPSSSTTATGDGKGTTGKKFHKDTGVSDRALIDEMFG